MMLEPIILSNLSGKYAFTSCAINLNSLFPSSISFLVYVLTLLFSNIFIQSVKPASSTLYFKEASEYCVNEPLKTALPFDLIVKPLLPVFMTKSIEPPKIPCRQEVDDALVKYSNKQPFTDDYTNFPRKPDPLLLVLVIISGIVSDYVGCLCTFKTLLTSKCPLIDVSLYLFTLLPLPDNCI